MKQWGTIAVAVLAAAACAGIAGAQRGPRARSETADTPRERAGPSRPRDEAGSITESIECSACHTTEGWAVAGAGAGSSDTGFDHAITGFPLGGRHRTVPCTGCHVPGRSISRDCASCHRDEHDGRLGSACDSCHGATSWHRTDAIAMHRRTRLPLTGMHALADCTECHQQSTGHRFTNVPADCFACHQDDYLRPDVHPNHGGTAGSPPFPRDCSMCHAPSGWSPAFVDPAILPRSSGLVAPDGHDLRFAISFGPHRGTDCASCHVSTAVPAAVECTGCHAHSVARIASVHASPVPTDGRACLSCHPGGAAR